MTTTTSSVPSTRWEMLSDRIASSVASPPALRMMCASPRSIPSIGKRSIRVSMHDRTATLRRGRGSPPGTARSAALAAATASISSAFGIWRWIVWDTQPNGRRRAAPAHRAAAGSVRAAAGTGGPLHVALPGFHAGVPRALRAVVHAAVAGAHAGGPDDGPRAGPPPRDGRPRAAAPRQRHPRARARPGLGDAARAGPAPAAPAAAARAVSWRARQGLRRADAGAGRGRAGHLGRGRAREGPRARPRAHAGGDRAGGARLLGPGVPA